MYEDSMDSYDMSLNESKSVRLSRVFQPAVEDNDDREEKKAQKKRDSNMFERALGSKHIKEDKTINSEQITNHYGNCIKLSTENKITYKNAFDLHLIDYLNDHLKNLQSFQVVSTSLDAGAKIYAGRVDSVHGITYQILSGCNDTPMDTAEDEASAIDQPLDTDEVDENNQLKTRRAKKRGECQKKMTCTNIRKIRLTSAQIRNEVDPLFQSEVKKFDEAGVGELRLNNLKVLEDTYELLLDFDAIVSTRERDGEDRGDGGECDIEEFSSLLTELARGQMPVCKEFEGFRFTGWDRNAEIDASEIFKSMHEDIADDHYQPFDYGGDCDYDDNPPNVYMEPLKGDDGSVRPEEDPEEDNLVTLGSCGRDETATSLFVSSIKEMVNNHMDQFGAMNDSVLGMWAGPDHWREKARQPRPRVGPKNTDGPHTTNRTKRAVKVAKPMFPDWVATKVNTKGIGRLVDIHFEDEVPKNSKISTQLTDDCLNKNIKKEYLLPPRVPSAFKALNQLMNREISLVNKALKRHAETMSAVATDNQEDHQVEENILDDVFEVRPADMIVIDAEGNVSAGGGHEDEYDHHDDADYDGDAYGGEILFQDFEECEQTPVRSADVDINYARTAKRINVRKLKQEIVGYLTTEIGIRPHEEVQAPKYPNLHMAKETCSLEGMIDSVNARVGTDVSKELSVGILMTCLLHLANEASLDVRITDRYVDFLLGQGFSAYDLDQVAKFGLGNSLLMLSDSVRKRKSDGEDLRRRKRASVATGGGPRPQGDSDSD